MSDSALIPSRWSVKVCSSTFREDMKKSIKLRDLMTDCESFPILLVYKETLLRKLNVVKLKCFMVCKLKRVAAVDLGVKSKTKWTLKDTLRPVAAVARKEAKNQLGRVSS